MGNLGLYQWLTTVAKMLGGPLAFLAEIGALGYLIGKGAEFLLDFIR